MNIKKYLDRELQKANYTRPIIHNGRSRTVRLLDNGILLSEFKDTVYSNTEKNVIHVDGTAKERVKIYEMLHKLLVEANFKSSAISFYDKYVCHQNVEVAEKIEVIIKTQLIGSPKHIYQNITKTKNRFGEYLNPTKNHTPYVRFDWRGKGPNDDIPMPIGLADYFIDTSNASKTALQVFQLIQNKFMLSSLHLIDACFYMSTCGTIFCIELSPDNLGNIIYNGKDYAIKKIINTKDKTLYREKYQTIRQLLEN